AGAGNRDDSRVVADRLGELRKLSERLDVLLAQFVTGRQSFGIGGGPATGFEEALCGGVEVVLPRGEESGVAPVSDRTCCRGSGLEDDERQAALGEMGGCGQADGTGADDDYGMRGRCG